MFRHYSVHNVLSLHVKHDNMYDQHVIMYQSRNNAKHAKPHE